MTSKFTCVFHPSAQIIIQHNKIRYFCNTFKTTTQAPPVATTAAARGQTTNAAQKATKAPATATSPAGVAQPSATLVYFVLIFFLNLSYYIFKSIPMP
jgi:hypothetical protein